MESDSNELRIHESNMEEAKFVLEKLKAPTGEGIEEDMEEDSHLSFGRQFAPGAIVWATYRKRWWPARVSHD